MNFNWVIVKSGELNFLPFILFFHNMYSDLEHYETLGSGKIPEFRGLPERRPLPGSDCCKGQHLERLDPKAIFRGHSVYSIISINLSSTFSFLAS